MRTLDIIDIGHPTLRMVGDEVPLDQIKSPKVQTFIDQLIATKREAQGAGIAANQVDNTQRIFVVEVGNNPRYPYKPAYPLTVMINPKITLLSEERFGNFEGCLSIPNLRGVVQRCPRIRVQGYNRDAEPVDFEVNGISAGTFQHEDDHLNGILFTDIVEDRTTLCTWEEFSLRYEDDFRQTVESVVAKYGS